MVTEHDVPSDDTQPTAIDQAALPDDSAPNNSAPSDSAPNDSAPNDSAPNDSAHVETDEELELETFDLDHDGKISIAEQERARLGLVDARLEEIAGEGGIKGKLAGGAHHILDKFDND